MSPVANTPLQACGKYLRMSLCWFVVNDWEVKCLRSLIHRCERVGVLLVGGGRCYVMAMCPESVHVFSSGSGEFVQSHMNTWFTLLFMN